MNLVHFINNALEAGQIQAKDLNPFLAVQVNEFRRRRAMGLKLWKGEGFYGGRRLYRMNEGLSAQRWTPAEYQAYLKQLRQRQAAALAAAALKKGA